jgi:endonuclease YncB( thermonuclease family)
MKLLITILASLLLLLSGTYTAKVIRVSDGVTITVLTDNKEQIPIRFEGIEKVEMPDDKKKLDLYIGYMVRLNELEGSG